ncbi:MAG: TlyA family RNA methyltransferase [Candidatus Caenarcaniphilales bacterium]|nr:TlyA family RNA methyltransferase [Candidatus Caenarcaniphilales bacterium]
MQEKVRLDQLILDLGYFDSREKARSAIMQGCIYIDGKKLDKAGHQINLKKFYEKLDENSEYLKVDDKLQRYVSRGAFKLEAAYKEFQLDFTDAVVFDIGASTGGFTDFSLQHGAKKALALDVGKAQLHYKLHRDDRVVNLEGLNFRNFTVEDLERVLEEQDLERLDYMVSDLSFISLTKVADRMVELAKLFDPSPRIVLLLKPQFEAEKSIIDKCKGIIRDDKVRDEIITQLIIDLENLSLKLKNKVECPVKGTKGNVEYLAEFEVV